MLRGAARLCRYTEIVAALEWLEQLLDNHAGCGRARNAEASWATAKRVGRAQPAGDHFVSLARAPQL